jgi:hypothetical protein
MQVIFAALVFMMAGFVFLVFLIVPKLRRHALEAVAAVFGFAAGSMGSVFAGLVFCALSGYTEDTLWVWTGVPAAILVNAVFYGGGILGAWFAVRATAWLQAKILRVAAKIDRAGLPKSSQLD